MFSSKRLAALLAPIFISTIAASAGAADISGITVNGEASFDYNVFSIGDNAYPASGGAGNNQYHFSQAQVTFKKETDQISFLGRLIYQPTAVTTPSGTATNDFGTLEQIEVYYKIRPDLQFGFGRLATTLGMESQMRSANALYNYSVAYQGIVPIYGEGATLRYSPGEWLALSVASYNRAAYSLYGDDSTSTKTTEVSATGALGPLTWFGGYYWGTDTSVTDPSIQTAKTTSNAWAMWKITDTLGLNVSYDARTQKDKGSDASVTAQSFSSQLAYTLGRQTFAGRYENLLGAGNLDTLNNTTGLYYPSGINKVQVFTVGDKITFGDNLDLHVEYRTDYADHKLMKNGSGGLTDKASMFTVGVITHF